MDVAYNQHAARRKSRSSTNLNHLSLAPLTTKLPLETDDVDDIISGPIIPRSTSYLQGKSAPTTPRLLSRSPGGTSRSNSRSGARLPKSKSATHLVATPTISVRHSSYHHGHPHHGSAARHSASVHTSPTSTRRKPHNHDDRKDSDWLLRAGALISTETRESKGQAWLVSRASSTSLGGLHDAETEAFERELARERELASRTGSRRGSVHEGDGLHHHSASLYSHHSPTHSRFPSRSQSRVGSRTQLATPSERRSIDVGGYFPMTSPAPIDEDADNESLYAGPDFVNLDEKLEAAGLDGEDALDDINEDEATVRRLVKRGNGGVGAWFGNLVGVQLFSVEEDEEEDDEEDEDDADETEEEGELSSASSVASRGTRRARFADITTTSLVDLEEQMPPPKPDVGGWHDAAWLLSVASKVLL
ncbi:Protein of unknown function (DUF3984) domain containing protein [Naviculisporaceae sp. PSN 640]